MFRVALPLRFSVPFFGAHLAGSSARNPLQPPVFCPGILTRGLATRDATLDHIADNSHGSKYTPRRRADVKFSYVNRHEENELEGISEGKGKLDPTSSRIFKLILPLSRPGAKLPPTVFLLHPSQPLSYVAQLILKSLAPATPEISFRSASPDKQPSQWCDSTDVGDFVGDAAKAAEFQIVLTHNKKLPTGESNQSEGEVEVGEEKETVLRVQVPTFTDRTRFLRRRLEVVGRRLEEMKVIKKRCDRDANRDAKRLAVGGLGMLMAYWAGVCRLTFWEFGWEVMEPITYLSGLTMAILGYLWFLYQGREVSYSSVLNRSISKRREALYHTHGFDIELWTELIAERKSLYKEIERIAEDYNENQDRRDKEEEVEEEDATKALAKDRA